MSVRLLLSMMVAMALSLAPFVMRMGEASAAPAAGHHEAMATSDHCDGKPAPAKSDSHKSKPCCIAGCMATAMLPAMGEAVAAPPHATERPGMDLFYRGYLGEIATPPPRIA